MCSLYFMSVVVWFIFSATEPCSLSRYKAGGESFYISGQRIEPGNCNSTFVWKPTEDNAYVPLNYTNWFTGEPNCASSNSYKNESCIHYQNHIVFQWNDIHCGWTGCPICEYTPQMESLPTPVIQDDVYDTTVLP